MKTFSAFLRDESGVIAMDWAVITGCMVAALVLFVHLFSIGVRGVAETYNAGLSDTGTVNSGGTQTPTAESQ